ALNMLRYADQGDAGVLTYTGFATRKLGDVRGGMRYYAKALSIDPTNTITRSYLGEAFLMQDQREKAAAELDMIASIEGQESEPYIALAKAIAAYDDGTWTGQSY
ncbi:MAG: tetratricopeptide repeat protein, partial [Pseudomonadota bacterium]